MGIEEMNALEKVEKLESCLPKRQEQ